MKPFIQMNSGVCFTNWNMMADSEAHCFVICRNKWYSTIEKRLINDLYIINNYSTHSCHNELIANSVLCTALAISSCTTWAHGIIVKYHISYHIISYHIISYHIISYHIIIYHIIYHIHVSYIILYLILYHISYHISYHHISYHIISYNIYSLNSF